MIIKDDVALKFYVVGIRHYHKKVAVLHELFEDKSSSQVRHFKCRDKVVQAEPYLNLVVDMRNNLRLHENMESQYLALVTVAADNHSPKLQLLNFLALFYPQEEMGCVSFEAAFPLAQPIDARANARINSAAAARLPSLAEKAWMFRESVHLISVHLTMKSTVNLVAAGKQELQFFHVYTDD